GDEQQGGTTGEHDDRGPHGGRDVGAGAGQTSAAGATSAAGPGGRSARGDVEHDGVAVGHAEAVRAGGDDLVAAEGGAGRQVEHRGGGAVGVGRGGAEHDRVGVGREGGVGAGLQLDGRDRDVRVVARTADGGTVDRRVDDLGVLVVLGTGR